MLIIELIAPLALTCLLGFFIANQRLLTAKQLAFINKITFHYLIPLFLFHKMATANIQQQFDWRYFACFYLPVLLCYALAWIINYHCHRELKGNASAAGVFALTASYSNTVIIGLPILYALLGDKAIGIIFMIITFHSALLFTITTSFSNTTETLSVWQKLTQQMTKNTLVVAILSGLIVNLSPIRVPDGVSEVINLLSWPTITLALLLLGTSLSQYKLSQQKHFITLATLFKLVLLPTLVYFFANHLFQLPNEITTILVILSASPTGVNAYLIASSQQLHRETSAGTVVFSSLCSIVTLSLWLIILD
ncbi:permease [Thalassotalea insulae]|uniref:Permease n=1 Tax=Thalassotalea insulae TaxID=2056778 RepID=A0ABQ6GNW2_9GAMM|nr:AEC family transporter [Thalassotalea insulae]GLX77032.1 permease [Thalassotalea insulae]